MYYIPKIDDYLDYLNLRKVAKLLCIILTTADAVEKYEQLNSFANCILCYNVDRFWIFLI